MAYKKYNGGTIKPRNKKYQASFTVNGRHVRRSFDTVAQARGWIDAQQIMQESKLAPPSASELIEYREARALLPSSFSVIEAVRHFIRTHAHAQSATITVAELCDQFMADRHRAGLRPRSIANLRYAMEKLVNMYGSREAGSITATDMEAMLDAYKLTGYTRDGYRRALNTCFSWAIRRNMLIDNPASGVTRYRGQHAQNKNILSPDAARTIISVTAQVYPPLLTWHLFKMYTGIRSSELERLTWEHVGKQYLRIPAHISKTKRDRLVPLRPNFRKIAEPMRRPGQPIPERSYTIRKKWNDRISQTADIQMPHNMWRDSFISYRLAETKNLHQTAEEAGNSAYVAIKSYIELVTPRAATAYWNAGTSPF